MSGKRGSVLAMALALGLGLGVMEAPVRPGKARKALSVKSFWAAAVGWWWEMGTGPQKEGATDPEGGSRSSAPARPLLNQEATEGGAYVDPNG